MRKINEYKRSLKEKVSKNNKRHFRIRKEYLDNIDLKINDLQNNNSKTDDLQIIGITGSTGKSTTAYLLHEYLKSLGYKSCLFSSCKIDAPSTFIDSNSGVELSFKSEDDLLDIIEACESYKADFLVLEVNETNIFKGLVNDIPFKVKVLTNLIPEHNLLNYTKEEYVNIKKSFFTGSDSLHVIGYQGYNKDIFYDLVNVNKENTLAFSSDYISKLHKINSNEFKFLLTNLDCDLSGINFTVNNKMNFKSNNIFNYNVLNYLAVITTLNALNLFDESKFNNLIKSITIPGRSEVFKNNKEDSLIIVDVHMTKALECLKGFKDKGLIDKIKVVVGSIGSGYKYWDEVYKISKYKERQSVVRENAMKLLNKYVDFVYLTETDSGTENPYEICKELESYLDENMPSVIITDRYEAITKAVNDLKEKEALLITGRGNRKVMCTGETSVKLFKDSDAINNVLNKDKALNKR